MDWNDLRLFLGVAQHRSMSEASHALNLSVATIGRRLDALERSTGLRLVLRTPRGIALTPDGVMLRERADALLREAAELERAVALRRAAQSDTVVRVSATEPVIAEILAPNLPALLASRGAPRLELRVENEVAAIALNDADVAIRLVKPQTGGLMAKRIATLAFGLYGAASMATRVTEHGTTGLAVLTYDDRYGPILERNWIDRAGLSGQVAVRMSSTRGLVAAVAAGAGVAILPTVLAEAARLCPLPTPDGIPLPTRDMWLVWPRSMSRHKPTRLVLDWIQASVTASVGRPAMGRGGQEDGPAPGAPDPQNTA